MKANHGTTDTAALDESVQGAVPALKGEGEVQFVRRERSRIGCDNCGEPADERHSYLLENARRNPNSKAFGRDDCSWCSDAITFSCAECRKEHNGHQPDLRGLEWCATFRVEKFPHMFLHWVETPAAALIAERDALRTALIDMRAEYYADSRSGGVGDTFHTCHVVRQADAAIALQVQP